VTPTETRRLIFERKDRTVVHVHDHHGLSIISAQWIRVYLDGGAVTAEFAMPFKRASVRTVTVGDGVDRVEVLASDGRRLLFDSKDYMGMGGEFSGRDPPGTA
jgi:hypothetical protein